MYFGKLITQLVGRQNFSSLCSRFFGLSYDSVYTSWSDHAFAELAGALRREERATKLSTEE